MEQAPLDTRVLLDGIVFPEGPRWHGDRLWFSDMHGGRVVTVDADGRAEIAVAVPRGPSGLGWLPDGRLLVVSTADRRLLRQDPAGLVEVADLTAFTSFACNDMVVDAHGNAYVGTINFDIFHDAAFVPAPVLLVRPDGDAAVAAADLDFPNGSVITPDGRTLIVGETFGSRLTAFDVRSDGTLAGRRTWAAVEGMSPDGICLDAEGAVWVASPVSGEVLRVREGGAVAARLRATQRPYACMLGGPERRTLFVCTAPTHHRDKLVARAPSGRIEVVEVGVPGAGLP